MYVDTNTTFGEGLDLSSAGVVGDAIDIGTAYGIGSGARRNPIWYVVAADGSAITAGANVYIYASEDGETTYGTPIISFSTKPIKENVEGNNAVLYSGALPAKPGAPARYLLMAVYNNGSGSGKVNSYILNRAPNVRIHKGV